MEDIARTVRIAARALGRAKLVHAYGHCSARLNNESFLVCPSVPMEHVQVGQTCPQVLVMGPLPDGVLGEVRLHQQIYARRPDAGGVVRFMGPHMMTLAALAKVPQIRHGFGTYFTPRVGFWDDIQLVRDDERAKGVIDAMGDSAGVIMRGNGAVVTGATLPEAVGLAWYLEDMCKVELAALSANLCDASIVTASQAEARATRQGGIFERMWNYLTYGDPELPSLDCKPELRTE
ncbi:class II aldolase/adducin family protein [Ahrensia kielensis]|uniref:class II aldolase/adducin family protein n=1 Tax=Ahrensia kielensis TaxID=76980 RepID=UPI000399C794|nr:class II aldolase/adducin family protein [Ahrensia kielensis]